MDTRCRLGKWLGFLAGMLLGTAIMLVPAVIGRLLHPNNWAGEAHALGPRMGFMYGLLSIIPVAFLVGLFFGIIGQAWGGRWQKAAQEKSARLAAVAQAQQEGNVWPPLPIQGDTGGK